MIANQPKDLQQMEAHPATMALEDAHLLLNQIPNKRKRNRKCVFGMEELEQETSEVELSMDFPIIEWQFTDESRAVKDELSGSTNEDSGPEALLQTKNWLEMDFGAQRSKRRLCERNRLVRCPSLLSMISLQASR
jgi:hypothetical protein